MGRGKPPRMRDLPHSHSVPRHAIVQANGSRGTFAPPRLESVRHRPCGFPAAPHVAGGIGAGLWLDLPASFRSSVNLAADVQQIGAPYLSISLCLICTSAPTGFGAY